MPLTNKTTGTTFPHKVAEASTFFTRISGLLGTRKPIEGYILHIIPCSGIHTFMMRYPIDVVMLGKDGTVLKTYSRLRPWKITPMTKSSKSVLELPPGDIERLDIKEGHTVEIKKDMNAPSPLRLLKRHLHFRNESHSIVE